VTEPRDPLKLDSVIARFNASEKLLTEASERLAALGDAQASAEASAGALTGAATTVREAATSVTAMAETLKSAHAVVLESLTASAEFLRQTDLTNVLKTMKALSDRVRSLEKAQENLSQRLVQDAEDVQAVLNKLSAAVDRSAALEQERDEYKRQLSRLNSQIPDRTRRKLGI
jgi:chromosome segregation ATPase